MDESTADDGPDCIGAVFDQASDLTARVLSDRAGLSVSAAFVLNRINREGPLRLTTLARLEAVSQPSMTQLIQRLERHGLVERCPDAGDGRVALVCLTDAGRALIEQRQRARRDRLTALLANLPEKDRRALWESARVAMPILQRLVDDAEQNRPGRT